MATHRVSLAGGVLAVTLAMALLLLSGCSAPSTPLCDQAQKLSATGDLDDAAALYARADKQGEGGCASSGLATVGQKYTQAAAKEADGAAAEQAGNTAAAVSAYQDATALNNGDSRAAAGLARLGRAKPTVPAVVLPALPAPLPASPWWQSLWAYLGLLVLLVCACIGAWMEMNRRTAAAEALWDRANATAAAVGDKAKRNLVTVLDRVDADLGVIRHEVAEHRKLAEKEEASATHRNVRNADTVDALRSSIDRSNRVIGWMTDQFARSTVDETMVERVFIAETDAATTAGWVDRSVIDLRIVDVATEGAPLRQAAVAVLWTAPNPAQMSDAAETFGCDPVVLLDALNAGSISSEWAKRTTVRMLPPGGGVGMSSDYKSPLVSALRSLVCVDGRDEESGDGEGSAEAVDDAAWASPLARLAGFPTGGSVSTATVSSAAGSGLFGLALEVAAGITGMPSAVGASVREHPGAGPLAAGPRPPSATHATEPAPSRAMVKVYVLAEPHARTSVRGGANGPAGAHIEGARAAVLGDSSKLSVTSVYIIDRITFDTKKFAQSLSSEAKSALARLARDPSDKVADKQFCRSLRPSPAGPDVPGAGLVHESTVPADITTVDCDVVAIGRNQRHDMKIEHRVATAKLDLGGLLSGSRDLRSAFARQIDPEHDRNAQRDFDSALRDAVGPEHLGSVLSTMSDRSPEVRTGPNRTESFDSTGTVVGKNIHAVSRSKLDASHARPDSRNIAELRLRLPHVEAPDRDTASGPAEPPPPTIRGPSDYPGRNSPGGMPGRGGMSR